MKLSVVVPVFNEKNSIREILSRVEAVDIPKEIVVVDDHSTDGTREILKEIESKDEFPSARIIFSAVNRGKGAAIREGIRHAQGDFL